MLPSPTFLALGHVTRDLLAGEQYLQNNPKDEARSQTPTSSSVVDQYTGENVPEAMKFTPGGTVTFAALTAFHLGLAAAIVTCADPILTSLLPTYLPHIALHIRTTEHTTTFANQYQAGFRTQYMYARSDTLIATDVPIDWLATDIILFAPLAQEIDVSLVRQFPRRPGRIVAASPQGWLRRWDTDGRVWPISWQDAELFLPYLDVLILSYDDLLPFADGKRAEAEVLLAHWSTLVPLLVATDGRDGATLFHGGNLQHFPAYPAQEIDPTGAGDVFAAAFLMSLYRYNDPARATAFANCTAAFSIEQPGIKGIPTLTAIEQRLAF